MKDCKHVKDGLVYCKHTTKLYEEEKCERRINFRIVNELLWRSPRCYGEV